MTSAENVAVSIGEGYSAREIEPWLRDVAARAAVAELLVVVDERAQAVRGSVCLMAAGSGFAQIARHSEAEF